MLTLLRKLPGGPGIWTMVLLFVALRLLQAAGGAFSYDDEDGFVAVAAWALVHGVDLPYQAFVLSDWELGSGLSVLLAAPLALLFGPSLFTLKLTALLFATATLVGLILLARRALGPPAGLLTGALYTLFPGPLLHYSLVAHGFHPESTALQVLFLYLLARTVSKNVREAETKAAEPSSCAGAIRISFPQAAVGFSAGISISYAYISVLTVLAGGLVWIAASLGRRLPARRRILTAVAVTIGGLFGLLPWLLYNLDNGFAGLVVYGDRGLTSYISPNGLGDKLAHFAEKTVPVLLHFDHWQNLDDQSAPWFAGWFWPAAAIGLLLLLPRTARHPRRPTRMIALVLALTAGLTLFVFVASRHPVYPWHLVPLLSLSLLALAGGAARLWRGGGLVRRLGAVALLAPILVWGGGQNLAEVKPGQLGAALWIDGRNRPLFYDRMRDLSGQQPPLVELDNLEKWLRMPLEGAMAAPGQSGFHTSFFGEDLYLMMGGDRAEQRLRAYLAEPMHQQFGAKKWELCGYVLARLVDHGMAPPNAALAFAEKYKNSNKNSILEGFSFGLSPARLAELLARLPDDDPRAHALARGSGRGMRAFALFDRDTPYCASGLPATLQTSHMEGLGHGMACRLVSRDPAPLLEQVCPAQRDAVLRGFVKAGDRCKGPDRAARRPPPAQQKFHK